MFAPYLDMGLSQDDNLVAISRFGDRIRVTVASTGSPLYEPNNQTGGRQTIGWLKDGVPAINTIHQGSRLIVPVVSPSGK